MTSALRVFFTITLPIIRPSIIGAALIAMALSLDEFIITYHTIGGCLTLPTMVWAMLRTSLDPDINALATLILIFTLGSTALGLRLMRRRIAALAAEKFWCLYASLANRALTLCAGWQMRRISTNQLLSEVRINIWRSVRRAGRSNISKGGKAGTVAACQSDSGSARQSAAPMSRPG